MREEFAAGRLSHDTFLIRMDAVLQARHQCDLPPLLADLVPAAAPPAGPPAGPAAGHPSRTGRLRAALDRWLGPRRRPLSLQFPRGTGTFFSIGRDIGCDLAIADLTVSRVHARLERTDDGWLLTDLDSTNGTRVNGWRVRGHVRVAAGDLVSFGRAEFWLTAAGGI